MKTENPGASKEAISFHYDIGNDFYRLFTEPTVSYSAALWDDNESYDQLHQAQLRKLDYHIGQARASSAKRVLDVGCGWGGMANRLVNQHGVERVIGITLSEEQKKYIDNFNEPKISVSVESWSDHEPEAPYDSIISMGAFEHFAKLDQTLDEKIAGYREFFSRCQKWLKPKGWMSLQTMAYGTMSREDPNYFIAKDIFPESDLPTISDIDRGSKKLMEIVRLRNDRLHYGKTYRAWLKNLQANRTQAMELMGEEFVDRWTEYFKTMIYGFEVGPTDLLRITLRRIEPRGN